MALTCLAISQTLIEFPIIIEWSEVNSDTM